MASCDKGDRVAWDWGSGTPEGTVQARYTHRVEKDIDGTTVVREASEDDPAYIIQQDDDQRVLKAESELRSAG